MYAAGVDVYIIGASPQLFAAEAGKLFGLGTTIPSENVYGVHFATNDAGLFTDNYPITWGPGKATIVSSLLQHNQNGTAPIYASGDATGDCEMLSTVRNGIAHTNNRLNGVHHASMVFTRKPASTLLTPSQPQTIRICRKVKIKKLRHGSRQRFVRKTAPRMSWQLCLIVGAPTIDFSMQPSYKIVTPV